MIEKFDYTKYELLCQWWKDYNWPNLPLESLPTTGFIVDNICAGFLYKTDSNMAVLEFIISDKKAKYEDKQIALDKLIEVLVDEAKKSGYNTIFTSVSHQGLLNKYKQNGFIESDKNMTNLIRRIN